MHEAKQWNIQEHLKVKLIKTRQLLILRILQQSCECLDGF